MHLQKSPLAKLVAENARSGVGGTVRQLYEVYLTIVSHIARKKFYTHVFLRNFGIKYISFECVLAYIKKRHAEQNVTHEVTWGGCPDVQYFYNQICM